MCGNGRLLQIFLDAFLSNTMFMVEIFIALHSSGSQWRTVGAQQVIPSIEERLEVGHGLHVMHVVLGSASIDTQREPVMGRPGEIKT